MSQVKIYGIRERLGPIKRELCGVIHECVVEALDFPTDKRFHRFFPFEESDFYYPPGRTTAYTIIEISMFEGRLVEAKKRLIGLLFERISAKFGISLQQPSPLPPGSSADLVSRRLEQLYLLLPGSNQIPHPVVVTKSAFVPASFTPTCSESGRKVGSLMRG